MFSGAAMDNRLIMEIHTGDSLSVERHLHPWYEFYYLYSGDLAYFVDGKIFTITKGDLIVIPPNTMHKSIAHEHTKRTRLLISLHNGFLDGFDKRTTLLPLPSAGVFHLGKKTRLQELIELLFSEYQEGKNPLMIKAMLFEFLILLSREESVEGVAEERVPFSASVGEILHFISDEYATDITLSSVAERFYMHPSYLSRIFKKNTGFHFSEYISKYRVQKAVELFAETDKNVTEVAMATGFNSSNHFCKTFKKIMGCSPLSYKKQILKNM